MYEVIVSNKGTTHIEVVEGLVFAEAARKAYSLRTKLGLDWKIISVRRIKEKP